MDQSREKIHKTIHYLASQISLGWNYFLISKFIGEAYEQNRIRDAHTIFKTAQLACWDSAVLSVAKTLDKNEGSLSMSYLLNCIKAEPGAYPLSDKTKLLEQISSHRKEVENLQTALPGLWEQRDRFIAHLDKRLVNRPESMIANPKLEMDNLHSAFRVLRRILEIYDAQTEAFSLWADESRNIWGDLEHLISLITQDQNNAA